MIYVRDKIEEIVNSIKSNGTVAGFVDNTGSYTITTSDIGNLQADFKVLLEYSDTTLNRDVIITSIDSDNNTFTFAGTGITQPDTWGIALYFEVGHRVELNKKYQNKGKTINKRVQEYPLFWLYTDFEKNPSDIEDVDFETTLQGALVDFTQKDLYEEQRIEQKFKPVLYPIIELIDEAFNSTPYYGQFITLYGTDKDIDFTVIDRPFFGSADQNANVLPQYTDAIEWQTNLMWAKEGSVCSGY